MGNVVFLFKNLNQINFKKNNKNILTYCNNYKKLLDILNLHHTNKNEFKLEFENFLKNSVKENEYYDLFLLENQNDCFKRSILHYLASYPGI